LFGAALLGPAPPLLAAISPSPAATSPVPPIEYRAVVAAAVEQGRAGDCAGALARIDPLLPRLSPGAERNGVQRLRLACLAATGRSTELATVQRELAAAMRMPKLRTIGSPGIAAGEGRFAEAAEQLAGLAEDDPDNLKLISGTSWRSIAQKLDEQAQFALRDRVLLALARADWQPQDRPDMRDALAQGAIEALLVRKEVDEAALLLERVEMPEILYAMATERLYEPLWPRIVARLGPHTGKAVDRFAASRLEDFARAPDDRHAAREAVRAFILLGRYGDADEVAAPIAIVDGMAEDDIAAVRYQAQALAALGRRGQAIARLRPFATIDLDRTPEAVSGLVGLAEALDEDGQPEQALGVARETLAQGGNALSEWGRMWLRRTEACALAALGRSEEARAAGDALKASALRNQPAAIEGLLCLKRDDEAAAIAVAAFATTEGASALADQFQPDGAIWAPAQSRLRALWTRFFARPDVKAAFERRARILPRDLWPSREPRPIPRKPSLNPGTVA
jgi:tetratricopeptide (TPR) repeat protein